MQVARVSSADGSRRSFLEALRDRLAAELDGEVGHKVGCECECGVPADARIVPPLAKVLAEIVKQLDELPEDARESDLDQLAAARLARRQSSQKSSSA